MTPDIRFLHFVETAARMGSFRKAAKYLGVEQSALSRRIQAMEDRLGSRVFERSKSGVRLTIAGEEFLQQAGLAAEQLRRAMVAVAELRSGQRGDITVGIVTALSSGFVRLIVQRHAVKNRQVTMRLHLATADEHVARVRSGEIDIAFLPGEAELVDCEVLPVWREQAVVALPMDHKLLELSEVRLEDLQRERFLVTRTGIGPNIVECLSSAFMQLGFTPHIEVHDVAQSDLINMVAMGFGIAVTSSSVMGESFPEVAFRPITDDFKPLPSSAVWRVDNQNPALPKFLEAVRAVSREYLRDSRCISLNRPGFVGGSGV